MNEAQLIKEGLKHHEAGRLPQAEAIYRKVLSVNPNYPDALHLLAVIAHQCKRTDVAVELVRRAMVLNPRADCYYSNYGVFLEALGRIEEAMAAYRHALTINPNYADVLSNLGNLARTHGTLDESEALCRRALAVRPDYPEALNNLANALLEKGAVDEAMQLYRRALELKPEYAQPYSNLGNAMKDKGLIDEAIKYCRRALELQPDYPDAMSNLAACMYEKGNLHVAADLCVAALKLRPEYPEALNNLGTALRELSQTEEAVAAYQHFIALRPNRAEVHSNLGTALKDLGKIPEAIEAYEKAMALSPKNAAVHGNRLLTRHYLAGTDAKQIFRDHQEWGRLHAEPLKISIRPHENDRSPDRQLRIGYVSADLRRHSVVAFLLPILQSKNPQSVHITCYPTAAREDEVTEQLRGLADGWTNLLPCTDEQAVEQIRKDRIDILVDLVGHTANNRLLVFARRPAPVQAIYLGYPNTSGMTAMDWRLTDEKADPPGAEELNTEKLIRLPETAWCFYPLSGSPEIQESRRSDVVFGSFNDFAKINTPLLRLWGRILNEVKGSRLLLKNRSTGSAAVRKRLHQELEAAGVNWERVELVLPQFSHDEHIRCYGGMDVGLDTFPYHGTTTTCEAMWMGIPVVTRAGDSHVSRVGVSLLKSVGLDELIARDDEEYIRLAVELANDRPRLAELRRTLRERMRSSPLMDAAKFTRNLEDAYRRMWHAWINT